MRVACIGGGPGGLFFAALFKRARPDAEVVVFERNRPEDTFGFGVVFSDRTLDEVGEVDPVLRGGLWGHGAHWNEIEVRLHGERLRCGGNGMAAIGRKTLLMLLRERAAESGAELRFEHEIRELTELESYDLVVAADGANSLARNRFADHFAPAVDVAAAKFIWFGTPYLFNGLTFVHERGPDGVFAVHGYPYGREGSTFLVETNEHAWRQAGLDEFDTSQPPGVSDEKSRAYLESLFADQIDGQPLWANNSRWANFRTVRTQTWRYGNLALLGDAAHTAHFSVGSGTKMSMEDAVALTQCLIERPNDLETALADYETQRRPGVEKIQNAARPSLSWWEHFGRYHASFTPTRFAFHFLTRALTRDKLARRDPDFVGNVDAWWRQRHGRAPLATPLKVGTVPFPTRAVPIDAGAEASAISLAGNDTLPMVPPEASPPAVPYGMWLRAPDNEDGLPEAVARLTAATNPRAAKEARAAGGPALAAIYGGTRLTRTLLSEEIRLGHEVPTLLVDGDLDADHAITLLLSGRADLVGAQPDTVAAWMSDGVCEEGAAWARP